MASEPARPEASRERALCNGLFDAAKWHWSAFACARIIAFILAVLGVTGHMASHRVSYAILVLVALAEFAKTRYDWSRSLAENLLRKLDLRNGLGWPVSPAEYSDLEARCPWLANRLRREADDDYYGSGNEPVGERRALWNTAESAWWSKHLCESMARRCIGALIVSAVVSVIALIGTIEMGLTPETARIVAAVWMLILPLGLVPLTIGYQRFAREAGRLEAATDALRVAVRVDSATAIKLVTDYHLARAGSPLIPTFIWEGRRAELNRLWEARNRR